MKLCFQIQHGLDQKEYDASPYIQCSMQLHNIIDSMNESRDGIGLLKNLTASLLALKNSVDDNVMGCIPYDLEKIPVKPQWLIDNSQPLMIRILSIPMTKKKIPQMEPYSLQWFHMRDVLRCTYEIIVSMALNFPKYDSAGDWHETIRECAVLILEFVNSWYFNIFLEDQRTVRSVQWEWLSGVHTLFRILPTFVPALENPEDITWFDLMKFQTWQEYGFRFIDDGCVVCKDAEATEFKVIHPCRHTCCVDCYKSMLYNNRM